MEALAHGGGSIVDSADDHLSHVVGMHVMHRFEPKIRQGQRIAAGYRAEHGRVEMPGRIERRPARTDDVARVNDGGGETA